MHDRPMRVLVTGATGFIGRHVVAELRERGADIVALARASSNTAGLEGIEIAVGDMTRPETLGEPISGCDAVIHLAALLKAAWKPDFHSANAEGTGNIAAACAAADRPPVLIVVSSLAAGGPVERGEVRTEEMAEIPVSRYGRAKLAAERAAIERGEGVEITVVRPPMVFGEHDMGSLPMFRAAARGIAVSPTRAPFEVCAVHARDLAVALVDAISGAERVGAEPGSGVYYAPGTGRMDLADFGHAIGAALDRSVTSIRMPKLATWAISGLAELRARLFDQPSLLSLDKYREATGGAWVCSGAKLRDHLDWQPADFDRRLAETVAWYRAQQLL
jgi:nucleoside-diphosphate-sugar epimerase